MKYIKEKKDFQAQLFGHCLLHFGYVMSGNDKASSILKIVNEIPEESITHPFPLARKYAANILQNYIDRNFEELEKWISRSLLEASNIKWQREWINFPYFQFVLADVFNIIERPYESKKLLEICELDFKRIPDFSLDHGYVEALDFIKAINYHQLGKVSEYKRISKRVKHSDVLFIMQDYFLIQRYTAELQLLKNHQTPKYKQLHNEIMRLIEKTNFQFFKTKFNSAC